MQTVRCADGQPRSARAGGLPGVRPPGFGSTTDYRWPRHQRTDPPFTLCWSCDRSLRVGDAGERAGSVMSGAQRCVAIAVVGADLRTGLPGEVTFRVRASSPQLRSPYMIKLRETGETRRAPDRDG
jgi:hypothetical protein